jgi:hypothetical protein
MFGREYDSTFLVFKVLIRFEKIDFTSNSGIYETLAASYICEGSQLIEIKHTIINQSSYPTSTFYP